MGDFKKTIQNINEIDDINDVNELFGILVETLKILRSPNGCVWDREQDHDSIKKNMVEEAYEALDAIEKKDYQSLKEELGDLLLQVIFHSQIAYENNEFELQEVLKGIIKKLYRRHPHVFGDKNFTNSAEVLESWEEIKKQERKDNPKKTESIFNDIPKILPSLHYANEIQNRASRLGFDWENAKDVFDKIIEEINELKNEVSKFETINNNNSNIKEEIGDLLFSIVNFSRHLNLDSEECLKQSCMKFINRFNEMEKIAKLRKLDFKSLSLQEKDKLWEEVKNID